MTTPLRPFFSYYGGKWYTARRYPAPRFTSIVEPFAGSAGYSLRYPDRAVTLYDANEKVAGTWQYLIAVTGEEIERLPLLVPGQSVDDLDVCQEARWLIGWWLNKGMVTPCRTMSAWGREPRHATQFWGPEIRARIAGQLDAVRHWRVIHGSYADAPEIDATWFIDPPYDSAAGRRYPCRSLDYEALSEWVREPLRAGDRLRAVRRRLAAVHLPTRRESHHQFSPPIPLLRRSCLSQRLLGGRQI